MPLLSKPYRKAELASAAREALDRFAELDAQRQSSAQSQTIFRQDRRSV
jgi:hypothetical protein